jgi:hypothetical protein
MNRRAVIALLGGAALGPATARAQQGVRRIGIMMNLAADDPEGQARIAAFYRDCRKPAGSWVAMRRSTSGGGWVMAAGRFVFKRKVSGCEAATHATPSSFFRRLDLLLLLHWRLRLRPTRWQHLPVIEFLLRSVEFPHRVARHLVELLGHAGQSDPLARSVTDRAKAKHCAAVALSSSRSDMG